MTSRSPPISPDRAPHSAAGTPPAAAAAAALPPFRVRTVTAFVTLTADDFVSTGGDEAAGLVFGREAESGLRRKLGRCSSLLRGVRDALESGGYEVQTTRVATNPFGEWLFSPGGGGGGGVGGGPSDDPAAEVAAGGGIPGERRLRTLDSELSRRGIELCSVGPALSPEQARGVCPLIIRTSRRFCCSAAVEAGDAAMAAAAAGAVVEISRLGEAGREADGNAHADADAVPDWLRGGLGNFRFCAASRVGPHVPFFPASRGATRTEAPVEVADDGELLVGDGEEVGFAVGLENGGLARELLRRCGSLGRVGDVFRGGMEDALAPLQELCEGAATEEVWAGEKVRFLGIDTSLNPSLDPMGSVAEALEQLEEVRTFGGGGTLAAAAAVTSALQGLGGIRTTGYCGLMLPVCEDRRLAELAAEPQASVRKLRITQLLSISSVCGVGVDTVPIPGDSTEEEVAGIVLDVAGLAGRWDKPLSCRMFPHPGKAEGEETTFESPYLCNSRCFALY